MKQFKDLLKLTNLKTESLNEKELIKTIGLSGLCSCGCYYSGCGGSSSTLNAGKNNAGDLRSILPAGDNWGYAY